MSLVEVFLGAVDDTRPIQVLAADLFGQYLPAKRLAQLVGHVFDRVLEDPYGWILPNVRKAVLLVLLVR